MVLSRKENVCGGTKLDDGCLMGGSPDSKRKNLVDLDDSKSIEGEDIADMLPNDPFEMDFDISLPRDPFGMDFDIEATVAAISGWVEAYEFETDEASEDKSNGDNKIIGELNFVWTSSVNQEDEGEKEVVGGSMMNLGDGWSDGHNVSGGEVGDLMSSGCEKYEGDYVKDCSDDGVAPYVIQYALRYLGVKDLLSVERVCRLLRDFVKNEDTVLWRNILIDDPLSDKITDDDLIRLTNRARGTLCSLSLVKCLNITNNGMRKVLESNPGLTKLSIPGCIKLKLDVVLHDLKAFNSVAVPGIKHLRIGELLGLTNHLFKEFKLLLGADKDKKPANYKLRFYRADQLHLSLDDERVIDIETCPRCHQARQVYDCPAESCQEKINSTNACRACIYCIARCISCGSCLDNKAYEETFCLDFLCFDCLAHLIKCQDKVTSSPGHAYFRQRTSYFFIYS
ncbi:hypothetical protein CDL12_18323 [Handroanthus impetiginosus]|uniref:F-box domain-containing protein n=1 Tax=Handroanthus impetiginosus TaxID=429701 RepID=A0A2G9GUZ7_9LAMI|nr:hypothetical protein CDL12_18323 [Handroanthus impetiginosus]